MKARLPRYLFALRMMRDEDEEMVYERGQCYVGDEKFAARTAFKLWRLMAVSGGGLTMHSNELERYHINETGRALLEAAETRKPVAP